MIIGVVLPGRLDTPTGGYRYDREMITRLKALGHTIDLVELSGDFPFPSHEQIGMAFNDFEKANGWDVAVVDGLAGGGCPDLVTRLASGIPVVYLLHHALGLEAGLTPGQKEQLLNSESEALAVARAIITTSTTTADTASGLFGIDRKYFLPVEPGVDRIAVAKPAKEANTINLLCVASVTERKGHVHLVKALGNLKHLDWKLDCIGMIDSDPGLYSRVCGLVSELGLDARITFHGAVPAEELNKAYQAAHVFVLPSLYEGYGMAFAEAIVSGIPVIGTTAGAIPNTVPANCGLLVEPGNTDALCKALERLVGDHLYREEVRLACLEMEPSFPDWETSGKRFSDILEGCL